MMQPPLLHAPEPAGGSGGSSSNGGSSSGSSNAGASGARSSGRRAGAASGMSMPLTSVGASASSGLSLAVAAPSAIKVYEAGRQGTGKRIVAETVVQAPVDVVRALHAMRRMRRAVLCSCMHAGWRTRASHLHCGCMPPSTAT